MIKLPSKYEQFLSNYPLPMIDLSFFNTHKITHDESFIILSDYQLNTLKNTPFSNINIELIIIHQTLEYIRNDKHAELDLFYKMVISLDPSPMPRWNDILFKTTYIDAILYDLDLTPYTTYPDITHINTFLSFITDLEEWPVELNFVFEDHLMDILKYTSGNFISGVLTSANDIIAKKHHLMVNQTGPLCNTINEFMTFKLKDVLPLYINDTATSHETYSFIYMYMYCMRQLYSNVLNHPTVRNKTPSDKYNSIDRVIDNIKSNLLYIDDLFSNNIIPEIEATAVRNMYEIYNRPLDENSIIEFLHFYRDYINSKSAPISVEPLELPSFF